jgi:hypothetical protein
MALAAKAADFATLHHRIALPGRGVTTDYQFAMSLPLLDDYNASVKYAVRKLIARPPSRKAFLHRFSLALPLRRPRLACSRPFWMSSNLA